MNTLVKVIIPIYKTELNSYETKSLNQCQKVLNKYPMAFVCPSSIEYELKKMYPQWEVVTFDDEYFKGISGYNSLMLSSIFYRSFNQFKYILIYHLDAWVFYDKLTEWCEKDYDYVGAPWLLKPKYYKFFPKLFLKFKALVYKIQGKPFRKLIVGDKVGNGGFSLRKVSSLIKSKSCICDLNSANIIWSKVKNTMSLMKMFSGLHKILISNTLSSTRHYFLPLISIPLYASN